MRATISLTYDRKKTSSTNHAAAVELVVYAENRQRYFSTGVKILPNQWDKALQRVKNSFQQNELNRILETALRKANEYVADISERNENLSFDDFKRYVFGAKDTSAGLVKFMQERAREKNIRKGTRKQHLSAITTLVEFGKIRSFSDITTPNIILYDEWLHRRGYLQTTIATKHKVIKTYINEAIRFGLIDRNPYVSMKIDRGESKDGRYVRREDIEKIKACRLPAAYEKIRDLAVVQFFTGLAYADLQKLRYDKITEINGMKVLIDRRTKTNIEYTIPLFDEALRILDKYPHGLPQLSLEQYNMRVKVVFSYAGVKYADEVSSHWLRRGCGYWLLNSGVSMETVSKILGHSSIKQTERIYAKLLPKSVVGEIKSVFNSLTS